MDSSKEMPMPIIFALPLLFSAVEGETSSSVEDPADSNAGSEEETPPPAEPARDNFLLILLRALSAWNV
jgi:hypothetical protein